MSRYLTEAIVEKHASTAFENSMRFYGSRWADQGADIKAAWRRSARTLLGEIVELIASEVTRQHFNAMVQAVDVELAKRGLGIVAGIGFPDRHVVCEVSERVTP